jgi:transmembrane sensor
MKNSNTVAAEAAEWLVDLQIAEIPHERQEAFADWLRRSPVHVEEFLQLTALQGDLARLPGIKQLDVAALLAGVGHGENVISLSRDRSRVKDGVFGKPFRLRWPVATAAVIVIALLLATPLRDFLSTERYATSTGEQRSLTLADGSQIQLNVRSKLSARLNDEAREVRLNDGEALFKVAKDAVRPFLVRTPQAVIRALGTQFNVHVRNATTVVALLEGRVEVQRAGEAGSVLLNPGEEVAIAARAAVPSQPRKADIKTSIAWTEHRLVFEDAPLSEVVEEFNRYSRQPLLIEDAAIQNARITASFDSGNARNFADSLAAAAGLKVVRRADGTWLIGR